ncbi:peptidylprolyl isomerase [Candidatus Woesearchaeota archaeon]|nr:peptidylprolyl isomerase [Candidatus Woesearchaeota archaeon]
MAAVKESILVIGNCAGFKTLYFRAQFSIPKIARLNTSGFSPRISAIFVIGVALLLVACSKSTATAVIETSAGTFTLELSDKTPRTTQNFIDLVNKGFYDGTTFHRVIPEFMIQGGDPLTRDPAQKFRWGTGGPGYEIEDEFSPELNNVRGTISMANHGPNTGGSQFFINVVDNTYLDNKHAVFGTVFSGMDVVDKISLVSTDAQNRPLEDVTVLSVKIK